MILAIWLIDYILYLAKYRSNIFETDEKIFYIFNYVYSQYTIN